MFTVTLWSTFENHKWSNGTIDIIAMIKPFNITFQCDTVGSPAHCHVVYSRQFAASLQSTTTPAFKHSEARADKLSHAACFMSLGLSWLAHTSNWQFSAKIEATMPGSSKHFSNGDPLGFDMRPQNSFVSTVVWSSLVHIFGSGSIDLLHLEWKCQNDIAKQNDIHMPTLYPHKFFF